MIAVPFSEIFFTSSIIVKVFVKLLLYRQNFPISIYYLTLICIKCVPEYPNTTFLVNSSTQKMPECSDSMNSPSFMPEMIYDIVILPKVN